MLVSVHKLTSRIGAAIEGLISPLSRMPRRSPPCVALNDCKVLVFDGAGASMTAASIVVRRGAEAPRRRGGHRAPTVSAVPGTTSVLAVDSEPFQADAWHSDVTFVVNPPQQLTLRSIVITAYGGEVLIATAAIVYRGLPQGPPADRQLYIA